MHSTLLQKSLRMKLFLVFLCLNYACGYPTNVMQSLIWPSETIDFVVICEEDERKMFLKLINDTVSEMNKAVGGKFISWSEISENDAIHKNRYIIFMLEKYECGDTAATEKGGFYLPLSISSECNLATNLRNLMFGLGFVYTNLRTDRDNFIEIHFDNIYDFNHHNYDVCVDCMTSDNEAFSVYDFNSVLHWPKYSIWAKNDSIPIITPKSPNIQMDETYDEKSFNSQDALIFKAIYG